MNCKDKSTFKRLADGAREPLKSAGAADADVAASESVAPAAAFSRSAPCSRERRGQQRSAAAAAVAVGCATGAFVGWSGEAYSSSMWRPRGSGDVKSASRPSACLAKSPRTKVGFSFKSEDGLTVTASSGIKVVMNKETGSEAAPHRLTMTRAQQKEFDEIDADCAISPKQRWTGATRSSRQG